MKFHFIDLFLFAGLVLGGLLGYRGGITKKTFNVLMLLGSIVAATYLMSPMGSLYHSWFDWTEKVANVFGFATIVSSIMIGAILLYRKFGSGRGMQNSTSQSFGVILGSFEGAMVTSLVLIMLKILGTPGSDTRQSSLLYRPLANFLPSTFDTMQSYLPGASGFREEMSRTFKDADIFEEGSENGRRL